LFCKREITITSEIQKAIDFTLDKFKHIDILMNAAGIGALTRIIGKKGPHELGLFKRIMDVNVVGLFDISRLAAEKMMKNTPNEEGEKGVIIHTSSIAAFEGVKGEVAYSASKAAVAGMTLPMARDLGKEGIRVCSIAPGLFDTPMTRSVDESIISRLKASTPFPTRAGYPREFAMLAKHIVENPMLNGETIRLDGAARMGYI
jgi:NAD(P)-dependent dehydrogenase (short-subunit alcohol dehydrogenase family)